MKLYKCLLFALFCTTGFVASEEVLLDFSNQAALKKFSAKDSRLSLVSNETGPALRIEAGTNFQWPGATWQVPEGLDFSNHGYLIVPVKNPGKESLKINCRIDSRPSGAPAKEPSLNRTSSIDLEAGQSGDIRIPLILHVRYPNVTEEDLFGMRGIPFFSKKSMHLANVTSMIFFITEPKSPQVFEIGSLRLEGEPSQPDSVPEEPFPFIDEFGQFKHRDWPGKTHSLEEMKKRRAEEAKHLAAKSPPESWDRFGGWKDGPQLEATGWFRTAKHEGKWYLVNPDGRLFFSLGIDCVGWSNETALDERRHWFEKLPPDDKAHAEFYRFWTSNMPKYHFFDKKVRAINFHMFNVMRKYGGDWKQAFAETSAARLPRWGVNTIANWSDSFIYAQRKVPYVAYVRTSAPPIEGSTGYWGKFADVFHPDFKKKLRQRLKWENIAITRDDPWCIGYFVDNELSWGDETSLATAALVSPPEQKAKQDFIADLKAKYQTIGELNKVWKTKHASWDALLASTDAPEIELARSDLEAFYQKIADTYFSSVREVLKEFSSQHLYLGCRIAWGNPITVKATPVTWSRNCR